jgi:type IV pilus assembly protein PilY1
MKIVIALLALTLAAGASAVELDLSRVPPSINASVPPNIMVTLDDSGSMGFGYTPDLLDDQSCFWRRPYFYSAAFNKQYYNPEITYAPPLREDGTPFPDMSYGNAKIDGFDTRNTAPAIDLSDEYLVSYWEGNSGFGTAVIRYNALSISLVNPLGSLSGCSDSDKRARFPFGAAGFYYRYSGSLTLPSVDTNVSNFTAVAIPAGQRTNFANWFSYYRTRGLAARTALTTAFADIEPSTRVAWQNFTRVPIAATTQIAAIGEGSTWRTNFFNWIQTSWNEFRYHPGYSGSYSSYGTPMRASTIRAGQFFQRTGSDARNPYWDVGYGEELSCRQNFHMLVTDGYWNEDNPTGTVPNAIGNYDRTSITLPDSTGYGTGNAASRVFWNERTGGSGCNGGNTCLPSLADITMYFWARDLRSNLENDVPSYFGDGRVGLVPGASNDAEIYFNPANDPANWQRMVNFIVGFGVSGTLSYSDETGLPMTKAARLLRLRNGTDQWPQLTNNSEFTIDDAWHAALNSRGEYLSAQNPQELINSLSAVLDNVSRRQGITGSAGSTAFLRSDAIVYEASYDSGSWTGDIKAFELNVATGEPTTVQAWGQSAAVQLDDTSPSGRRIFTNTTAGGQVDFRWNSLDSSQQTELNLNPVTNLADGRGQDRVDWIRGVRDEEQSEGGALRNRTGVLGPFIGSSLINVTAPRFGYRGTRDFPQGGSDYAEFRRDRRDRSPTLYIGSNDGMLHAFDAQTGAERWAYVPNRVVRNLARLTVPEYQFVPYVNTTPIDHDVLIDGEWRTVLVGTLGLGGQGVYAIDVTDPDSPRFLWEFTDGNDERLGYTYGRPNVYRLADGKWVAFVPAGYNSESRIDYATRGLPNERADSRYVANGNSDGVVFAIDIETGASKAIPVATARGLATVQAADYELDFKLDFLVAGDLNGDLWRIGTEDLTWATITNANVDKLFDGSPTRPITSAPTIYPDPATGKMIVVVGTGKYLEDGDREINIPRQAIYGIRECRADCDQYPIVQGELIEQVITSGAGGYLDMANTRVVPEDSNGWFIQLGNPALAGGDLQGERVIDMSLPISFASGIVAIGSYIPSSDPCAPMGTGVVYALSAMTGGYALHDGMTANGQNMRPGDPVFAAGGSARSVGNITARPPDMSAFISPDGGTLSAMGIKINGVPIRRRSGWRDIPSE